MRSRKYNNDLTQNDIKKLLIYIPKYGVFVWRVRKGTNPGIKTWNKRFAGTAAAGYTDKNGYCFLSINNVKFLVHRLVWLYVNGSFPPEEIDHVNGIRSDNRIINLRESTRSQQNFNRRLTEKSSTGRVGVSLFRGKYRARIQIHGKKYYLGTFDSIESASAVYQDKSRELFGDYSYVVSQEKSKNF